MQTKKTNAQQVRKLLKILEPEITDELLARDYQNLFEFSSGVYGICRLRIRLDYLPPLSILWDAVKQSEINPLHVEIDNLYNHLNLVITNYEKDSSLYSLLSHEN